jgi:hypothetical protein
MDTENQKYGHPRGAGVSFHIGSFVQRAHVPIKPCKTELPVASEPPDSQRRFSKACLVYCLSKTFIDVNGLPSGPVPFDVDVMVLPSFETTCRTVA